MTAAAEITRPGQVGRVANDEARDVYVTLTVAGQLCHHPGVAVVDERQRSPDVRGIRLGHTQRDSQDRVAEPLLDPNHIVPSVPIPIPRRDNLLRFRA